MSAISDGIELDPVERHRAQPREVRIAGAEIVDRDCARRRAASAAISSSTDALDFHRGAFGELELDQRQRNAGVGEESGAAVTKKSAGRPGAG